MDDHYDRYNGMDKLGTNLAEVGTDCISRQAAIDALRAMQTYKLFAGDDMLLIDQAGAQTELMLLPPAPPAQLAPDQNGDLWITVPDIDEVTCIYVKESKSKFCRIFYEEKEQPERIKGHWVNGRCDKCNAHAPFWCMASTYHESNFCPNCGADMREVTE